jgi:hypothetical protein
MSKADQFVAGFTDCPDKFLELGEHARAEGFKDIDCIMPYPVHGFEDAYGFKGSWIGLAAFGALLAGWVAGFAMQCWMHSISYPINIGGKPHISWPAFIPVTFECGILLAALTTIGSLIIAARLRPSPFLKTIRERCTDDIFSIIIPVQNEEQINSAREFLKGESIEDTEVYNSKILEPNQCGLEGKCC